MKKTGSISKDRQLKPSQDYRVLMDKGLEYVQGFSGDIWTDYNAHDPGVTILEQFCYGLTELGYKAAFPIEDLLVEADGNINWEKNSFHSPALVFSSHPVTVLDFRKLLIDTFPEIQNCWLAPVYLGGKEEGINGVYQVEVLPALAFQKELRKRPELAVPFVEKLHKFLKSNRNLGEDFDSPSLLAPHFIYLRASVEISEEEDPDRVMAEILFALEVHLYHPVAFTNLEELLAAGQRLEEVFAGPRLKGGFIADSQLQERSQVLYTEKLQLLISKIPGVKKCWDLALDQEGRAKSLSLSVESYAAINTDPKAPDSIFATLDILVKGNLQRLDKARVLDLLLDFWSKKYRVYETDIFRENNWQTELSGKFRNPGAYTSISSHFPAIYGLKPGEILSREPAERHAKVRQLKGYLLLMEKHLSNFLAQLAHLPDFFDREAGADQGTYFSQDLDSQIDKDELEIAEKLLPGFGPAGVNPQTGESRLSWLLRKNRVLDHLLARFGEEVQELPFQLSLKMNLLGSEEEMLAGLLRQKTQLLRQIPELGYGKHRALSSQTGSGMGPTVEQVLRIITGIGPHQGSLIPGFLPKNEPESASDPGHSYLKSQSSYLELTEKFRQLSKQERIFPQLPAPAVSGFSLGKIGIKGLFARAADPDSYWISREPSRMGTIDVLFQKSDSSWVSVWDGNRMEDALGAIAGNIQYFRALNAASEGMYLVDHISMRGMLDGAAYGFEVRDEWGKTTFRAVWTEKESERKVLLAKFYQALADPRAYRRSGDHLTLYGQGDELLASYRDFGDGDIEELIESMSSLAQLMAGEESKAGFLSLYEVEKLRYRGTLHRQGVFRQRSVGLLRRLKDGREIQEGFFELKASLILPDWPARFQDSHFRYFLTNELRNRVPAHLEVEAHWLSLSEFESFETSYRDWLQVSTGNSSQKQLTERAFQLYEILTKLKGGKHG